MYGEGESAMAIAHSIWSLADKKRLAAFDLRFPPKRKREPRPDDL